MGNIKHMGFKLDGVHSWFDMDIVMHDYPQISYPQKIKEEEVIAGTNVTYDVSTLTSGIQPYEKRIIKLPVNVLYEGDINVMTTQMFAEHIFNWVYGGSGARIIELDTIPHHYFIGEVVDSTDFVTNLLEIGYADIVFKCYPFRISKNTIGEKTFGEINIMNDFIQHTSIKLPSISNYPPQTPVVGWKVNIGSWARKFSDGSDINMFHRHQLLVIKSISGGSVTFEETDKTLPIASLNQGYSSSYMAIMNNGPANIIPEVRLTKFEGSNLNGGITIGLNGVWHPFVIEDLNQKTVTLTNEAFVLGPGKNELHIYGAGYEVEFIFREERL